ncbi:MAG TPA: hypothetical protein VFI47_11885 [Acidimicrobiales bacterium]|nr:hypothetical protein [Acidimicrobiales bacterium]
MPDPVYAVPLELVQIEELADCVHAVDQALTTTIEEHLENQNLENHLRGLIARIKAGEIAPVGGAG